MPNFDQIAPKAPELDPDLAAFNLIQARNPTRPILFASPHSGQHYPLAMREKLRVPVQALRGTEDSFVDILFDQAPKCGALLVSANYSRAYLDLNRPASALDADLFMDLPPDSVAKPDRFVKAGLGCIPSRAPSGELIYKALLSWEEGEKRLIHIHAAYHTYLSHTLDAFTGQFGKAILIDCHSMPSSPHQGAKLADIVLGDRYGKSCAPALTDRVEQAFRNCGFSVARNKPYAGGYSTQHYGQPDKHVHALQIEINRALYMHEGKRTKNRRFDSVKDKISRVIEDFCHFAQDFDG